MADCPFCSIARELAETGSSARVLCHNRHAFAIRDGFPVAPGHSLVIPRQHIGSFFELETEVQHAMLELLGQVKAELDQGQTFSSDPALTDAQKPHAYNIGINDGPEAGQTVPHCHLHLIPRYRSDVKDPRGGVRWVIPDKANYWSGGCR